jgi:hypothetical protein
MFSTKGDAVVTMQSSYIGSKHELSPFGHYLCPTFLAPAGSIDSILPLINVAFFVFPGHSARENIIHSSSLFHPFAGCHHPIASV